MKPLRYSDGRPVRLGDIFRAPRWGRCIVKSFDRLNGCAEVVNTQTKETFDNLGPATFEESDLEERKLRRIQGVYVERSGTSGLWSAFIPGQGTLRADTLAGLKNLITATLTQSNP